MELDSYTMSYDEVEAAKAMITEDTDDLSKYFVGLDNIRYLYSYEQLYEDARRDILTWNDAREAFLVNDRQELFWDSHRSYSHFVLLSHAVVEYLSSRILLQYFNPHEGRAEMLSALEQLRQYDRQSMMQDLGIISGRLNEKMNRVRGLRNDFAHEISPHFELNYDKHPVVILNEIREVTSHLVETLYEYSYQYIINLLTDTYSPTFPDNYSEASTAELIDIYQFRVDEDATVYNQDLPREFRERGVNPEAAPSFEEFESIDYLSDVGITWAGTDEISIVQLLSVPLIPDDVRIEEEIDIELQIEFSSDSLMYKMNVDNPSKFEWYCYLMVDDRVVTVYPTDSEGCPDYRKDSLDTSIPIRFNHMFRNSGQHDVKIGLQIVDESYRQHITMFETQTKAHGPFT